MSSGVVAFDIPGGGKVWKTKLHFVLFSAEENLIALLSVLCMMQYRYLTVKQKAKEDELFGPFAGIH